MTFQLKNRDELKGAFKSAKALKEFNTQNGTKYTLRRLPVELRPRLTRAMRHRLTKHQQKLRTRRQVVRQANFPARNYAVTA